MTNTMEPCFESILSAARVCDPANLPLLIGALEQAKAEAWGRLSTPVIPLPQETKAQQERLLTPEEAASIAPLSGKVDQGFGLVWRYKDANNYYITRCNADEDNCTIYHTVNGSRRAFLNQGVKVAKNTWHTLRLEAIGDHFVVWYDNMKVLDAKDETFKDAGKVGLWTKADSVIEFDDFTVEG